MEKPMGEPLHSVDALGPEQIKTADLNNDRPALDWLAQNGKAIRSSNSYVEAYGLPLAKSRLY